MIAEIVTFTVFGISLIRIIGIITYFSFVYTALISILNKRGINIINFKWHSKIALVSLILATIHATLVILLYLI